MKSKPKGPSFLSPGKDPERQRYQILAPDWDLLLEEFDSANDALLRVKNPSRKRVLKEMVEAVVRFTRRCLVAQPPIAHKPGMDDREIFERHLERGRTLMERINKELQARWFRFSPRVSYLDQNAYATVFDEIMPVIRERQQQVIVELGKPLRPGSAEVASASASIGNVEPSEGVLTDDSVGKGKRGPKRDYESAALFAEIVDSVAPDGNWHSKIIEICFALDEADYPIPKPWRHKRGHKVWSDAEPPIARKVINYRLLVAKQRSKRDLETLG
jgi:hypothetical protein